MRINGEHLYGLWATVSLEDNNQRRSLELLLNGESGLKNESLPLNKTGTVNTLCKGMFNAGLDCTGAPSEQIEQLKQSEYLSALLKRGADDISKLLSILCISVRMNRKLTVNASLVYIRQGQSQLRPKKDSGFFQQMAYITGR